MGKVILYKLLMGVWSLGFISGTHIVGPEATEEVSPEVIIEKPIVSEQPELYKKWARISSEWDEIFEQPEEYPENLLKNLKRNPEILDFVYEYPDASLTVNGGMTEEEKAADCPLFIQWDSRWGYFPYGSYNIGISGCGPTCLSMVIYSFLEDETATPDVLADIAMDGGYYVKDAGTAWTFLVNVPQQYGLDVKQYPSLDENGMVECLENDGLMIGSMSPGDFTDTGHFIVICGYEDGEFMVNDPFSYTNSYKTWDYETLAGQMKQVWCYSYNEEQQESVFTSGN